jgi:U3 small nucleolar ribonucleoprotein protein LCP5
METSLPRLLTTLRSSLETALLPNSINILPPANGISLLDLKNELFLSYLQNLVFLILIKLRHATSGDKKTSGEKSGNLNEEVTKKIAELRLYIEKGVKPLEGKLKYQIDKVVKAAENVTRAEAPVTNGAMKKIKQKKKKRRADKSEDSERSSSSESEEDDDASVSVSEIDELSYRPNPAALIRPQQDRIEKGRDEPADGIYRPPRITATAMPTTRGKEEKAERRPNKSATLDEFIATELSTAPIAEPSIGSTIVAGGRKLKTQRERDADDERRRYEEAHLTRLPKESKKDRAKNGGRDRGGFGGEDFRNLEAGLDRIGGLVRRKEGSGGKVDRSRKRNFSSAGLGGGDIGRSFDKRKRTINKRFR